MNREFLTIVDLEAQLDQHLQRPRVTNLAAVREAAIAWSQAVWSASGSAGLPTLTTSEIERGFAIARRPVFVLGSHRSGTTMVRDLLDHHPALSVLPAEGTMLTNFAWHLKRLEPDSWLPFLGCEWLRRLANPINQQPYWLLGRSSPEGSAYVEFARAVRAWWPLVRTQFGPRTTSWPLVAIALAYAHCTRGFGAGSALQRWVEKTPANERFLERLMAEFPEARMLHVVRHPFAVYASSCKSLRDSGLPSSEESRFLRQMRLSYREAASRSVQPASDSYLLVRYEDLLEDTASGVQRIASFLGIEPLPILTLPTANGIPTPSNSSFDSNKVAGKLNRRPADVEFNLLTARERERLSAMLADDAGKLGYPLPPPPALRRPLLQIWIHLGWVVDRFRTRWMRLRSAHQRP
ncbi:sulfotransferase family protein [Dyella kyungheensis]|uniref:Sulfotransferase n=1 Tax=Dyella kyungheensis TaxID=1242174 RepID=A0ABS2JX39_9GAMM|nr:sulfotransferase [Dyella kyungheensis]MBM7123027.1 sulfotransferase [Dyella kyungheensis]